MPQPDSFLRQIVRSSFLSGRDQGSEKQSFSEAMRLNQMLVSDARNAQLQRKFERAALDAGQQKMASEHYADACEVWHALRAVPSSKEKANRNLSISALKGARIAEAAQDEKTALRFWRYLIEADPNSEAASQGILRSTRALMTKPNLYAQALAKATAANPRIRPAASAAGSPLRRIAHSILRRAPGHVTSAIESAQATGELALAQPQNASLQQKFARAALFAGKLATASERYDEACQILSVLRKLDTNNDKAARGLGVAALRGARKAETEGRAETALQFWRYLQEADSTSRPAALGITRCMRNLI
jgi:tetratricopeptide (TPR) repeat protein